jgi:asparaginyl-tRNA synthetase
MRLLSSVGSSALRSPLLLSRRGPLGPLHTHTHAHALAPLAPLTPSRLRYSSTFSPPNLAALLSPASPPSAPQQRPSDHQPLTIHGYIRSVRKQKRIAFAAIGDGSTLHTVQAVLAPQLAEGLV